MKLVLVSQEGLCPADFRKNKGEKRKETLPICIDLAPSGVANIDQLFIVLGLNLCPEMMASPPSLLILGVGLLNIEKILCHPYWFRNLEANFIHRACLIVCLFLQTEGRMRGPGVGAPGRTSKRQSNETYRDAVRRVMFARYKELDWRMVTVPGDTASLFCLSVSPFVLLLFLLLELF